MLLYLVFLCYNSDAALSSLSPLESEPFDASKLCGMTPLLLGDLIKLTFIDNERVSTNPLFYCQRKKKIKSHKLSDIAKDDLASAKADIETTKNTKDIAVEVLQSPENSPNAKMDHNADKKGGSKENLNLSGKTDVMESKVSASMSAGLIGEHSNEQEEREDDLSAINSWQQPSEVTLMQTAQIQVDPN